MDLGVVVPTSGIWGDPHLIRDAVQAAEDLGYHTVWFGDHVVVPDYAAHLSPPNWFEPLSCAFVGAGATSRIRFGVDVLVIPQRHPVWLSQLVASADQLCDGRLTLGAGIGFIRGEMAALGPTPYERRGDVTDEHLAVLRLLWEGEGPLSFSGEWVSFEAVHAEPKPRQRPFPLWVGGNAAAAHRRAATLGTGWHPLFPTPAAYARGRDAILALRAEAGVSGPFTFSYSCPPTRVVLSDAEREVSGGYGDGGVEVPPEYSYAPPMPTTAGGRPMLVGDPDEVAADVLALADAGVGHLALRFSTGHEPEGFDHVAEQMTRFRDRVVPQLDDRASG